MLFILLTPRGDEHVTSPHDILALSNKKLTRILKLIGKKFLS